MVKVSRSVSELTAPPMSACPTASCHCCICLTVCVAHVYLRAAAISRSADNASTSLSGSRLPEPVQQPSDTAAGAWLGVLREIASWLPQSATITTGGALRRGEGQGRIAFLASVRNQALAPLWSVRLPV